MVPQSRGAGNGPPRAKNSFWDAAAGKCETVARDVLSGVAPEWRAAFFMARGVRGVPGADDHPPVRIAAELYRTSAALRHLYPCAEDFLQLFSAAWEKVRVLPGEDLIGSALRLTDAHMLGLLPEHRDTVTEGYRRFVSLCGQMCVALGTDLIKLPCREVGEALGVRKDTVSSYRQQAQRHGYLVLVRPHAYRPNGKGDATLFRFRAELWKHFDGKVPRSAAAPTGTAAG